MTTALIVLLLLVIIGYQIAAHRRLIRALDNIERLLEKLLLRLR